MIFNIEKRQSNKINFLNDQFLLYVSISGYPRTFKYLSVKQSKSITHQSVSEFKMGSALCRIPVFYLFKPSMDLMWNSEKQYFLTCHPDSLELNASATYVAYFIFFLILNK